MERNLQLLSDNHPLFSASLNHNKIGARRALYPVNVEEPIVDFCAYVMSVMKQEQFYSATCFGQFDSLLEEEPDQVPTSSNSYRFSPPGMPQTPYKSFIPSPNEASISMPVVQPPAPIKSDANLSNQVALFDGLPESDASTSSNSIHLDLASPPKSFDISPLTSPLQSSRKTPSISDIRAHASPSPLLSDTESSSTIPLPLVASPAARVLYPQTPRASPQPAGPFSSVVTPASRQMQINGIFFLNLPFLSCCF